MNLSKLSGLFPRIQQSATDVQQKSWIASKTVWFNLLLLAADLFAVFVDHSLPIDDETVNQVAIALAAIGNLALRFVTTKPVGVVSKKNGGGPPDPSPSVMRELGGRVPAGDEAATGATGAGYLGERDDRDK